MHEARARVGERRCCAATAAPLLLKFTAGGEVVARTLCACMYLTPRRPAVQVKAEVSSFLKMLGEVYKVFGLEYSLALSTRPEGYLGEIELWEKAEKALEESLNDCGSPPPPIASRPRARRVLEPAIWPVPALCRVRHPLG